MMSHTNFKIKTEFKTLSRDLIKTIIIPSVAIVLLVHQTRYNNDNNIVFNNGHNDSNNN